MTKSSVQATEPLRHAVECFVTFECPRFELLYTERVVSILDDELWTIHQNPDVSNPVPKTKNLLLVFPENVVIEWEDVVNRSLVNDENEFPGLSLTVSETHPNASGRSVGHFVYWKIGCSDIRMAKKGPVQQMRKKRLGFQFGFAGNEPSEGGGAAPDMAMS
ncbi:hypothetical protein IV203_032204 [Nitzschia inconspicua]|uniref:Uncharacterized protein n=1 Tax=Nitzschia inconspicua TaxID=303405 RepID=A0A9K3PCF5_9STRA|nr:hypothetical protein IV203_033486 [Nitzschia inconspicua]KAG7337039.1 hypothetical protein IV203_022803 [Nitzschia inconspicua]KAG7342567.1 hypothetical protein IV203_007660 [Nitzschia inconspicua]KAG7344673.1 hypothetical protein IV203_032204 [Nitzschia inconspicua]